MPLAALLAPRPSRSDATMVAVGVSTHGWRCPRISVRRVATVETSGVVTRRNILGLIRCPWVETHGYHRIVATRRGFAPQGTAQETWRVTIGGVHQFTPLPLSRDHDRGYMVPGMVPRARGDDAGTQTLTLKRACRQAMCLKHCPRSTPPLLANDLAARILAASRVPYCSRQVASNL